MKSGYRIEDVPNLRVILPARVHWLSLVIICLMAVGFNSFPWRDFAGQPVGFFRFAGPIIAIAALALLVWKFFGREVVSFEGFAVVLHYEVTPFGFSREFEWNSVHNLRPRSAPSGTESRANFGNFGFDEGKNHLAFDYGARTFSFGNLEPTEAVRLADELVRRFPQLRPEPPVVLHNL